MKKRHYKLKIQPDVTLLELAEIVNKSFCGATASFFDRLDEKTKRHCGRMSQEEIETLPDWMQDAMPSVVE